MTTIGFVGLGAMGSQMADRLLDSGNPVYGTNGTRSKAQELIDADSNGATPPAKWPTQPT